MDWFFYSVSATILFGISMTLFKVPSFKGTSRPVAVFWSLLTPLILSFILFGNEFDISSTQMILIASLWGLSFVGLSSLQMYALSHMDTNVLFPTTSMLSLILTLIVGMLFFLEFPSPIQATGMILAVIAVLFFIYKKGKLEYTKQVLIVLFSIFIFFRIK